MIALNNFDEEESLQPIVFYKNLNFKGEEFLGDCANCGKKRVSILEHDCQNPNTDMAALAIIETCDEAKNSSNIVDRTIHIFFVIVAIILILCGLF